MSDHLHQNLIRHSGDIGARLRAIRDMQRMSCRGTDDFRRDFRIIVENLYNITDQLWSVRGDIIQSSEKRGHIGRARPGCQKSLVCRKNQRYVRFDPFC